MIIWEIPSKRVVFSQYKCDNVRLVIEICEGLRSIILKGNAHINLSHEDAMEWIPVNRLSNIEEIGRGFGSVYKVTWLDAKQCDRNPQGKLAKNI
ncbi:hypothetical protein C2G38_2248243 [Gigaspora rosea]|uniref:Protein kinase domain-containing protein n=1 Tax=Gigaspora rosea TaxID=44941 RepID=A0A397UXU3_9GLOM|nr:hypothetical protein C2G38_2248243 [Gigaspora rosea]